MTLEEVLEQWSSALREAVDRIDALIDDVSSQIAALERMQTELASFAPAGSFLDTEEAERGDREAPNVQTLEELYQLRERLYRQREEYAQAVQGIPALLVGTHPGASRGSYNAVYCTVDPAAEAAEELRRVGYEADEHRRDMASRMHSLGGVPMERAERYCDALERASRLCGDFSLFIQGLSASYQEADQAAAFEINDEPASQDSELPQADLTRVEFSALAPRAVVKGEYSLINLVMYEPAFRHVVDELARSMDGNVREARSGIRKVRDGAEVRIVLSAPGIDMEDDTETGLWYGEYLNFSFAFLVPEEYDKKQIPFTAAVYLDDVITAKLRFIVDCGAEGSQRLEVARVDILSAFVSYASEDRNRVAAIIQGMQKARPEMDVFFDVESLRSGEDWEQVLYREIERRDILFLCWSHYARASKYVDAEWRYALEKKGIESIEPIPIEPPDKCPPPAELHQKHFNDKLLYIINAGG